MSYTPGNFERLSSLIIERSPNEGPNPSPLKNVWGFRISEPIGKHPIIDSPAIWLIARGHKVCTAGNQKYDFTAGDMAVLLFPMAIDFEILNVSPETPLLSTSIFIDLARMADVLLRMDRIEGTAPKPVSSDPSGMFSMPLDDNLIDSFIRLFSALKDPKEAEFLGDALFDEIYFRLFSSERGDDLRHLLQQRGEIQRISKAVQHIHENIDQTISVEELAKMVHMGQTSFYENFKKVMHLSPLQYAKSVKLHQAQLLIQEGKRIGEAAFMVGYNNTAQFSREYKRHFGYSPSAT